MEGLPDTDGCVQPELSAEQEWRRYWAMVELDRTLRKRSYEALLAENRVLVAK